MEHTQTVATNVLRTLVVMLFAACCYATGFNTGYQQGHLHNVERLNERARTGPQVTGVDDDAEARWFAGDARTTPQPFTPAAGEVSADLGDDDACGY